MWTPPAQIDEFRIEGLLGRGGMGGVWRARDVLLARDVAIKIADGPEAAETRLRARMEARAIARLQHPNIVGVHRAGEVGDRPFLVTELLSGRSLDQLELPLPVAQVIAIGADLSRGLCAAHAAGVLHRDVKPGNAFLCEDGTAKLLDFGLAQVRHGAPAGAQAQGAPTLPGDGAAGLDVTAAADASSGHLAGTPLYMAPETWLGAAATRATDVYSLGALLFELLTGAPPYAAETLPELRGAVLAGGARVPAAADAPSAAVLADRVASCLSREPERRPTAEEICHTLEALSLAPAVGPGDDDLDASPYPGLRTFEPEDQGLFHGRETETGAVVAELRVAGLVLVVGASGSGKSSLVRAGVVPLVQAGVLGPRTRAVILVPGSRPIEHLARAASSALGVPEAEALAGLTGSPAWLARALGARRSGERLLLVVDQLEEAFTLATAADRARFFEAIAALVAARPLARVVATLRSDFLPRLEELGELRGAALSAAVVLGPVSPEGLRRAIVEPARRRGVVPAEDLVEQLVEAARAHAAGALPLLEFALATLWQRRASGATALGRADLAALGGLTGALATYADAALARMTAATRAQARRLLLALVTLERTRARREEQELGLDAPDASGALHALVAARLVVASAGEHGTSYEIAHEALVSEWPALRGWLDQEASAREIEARLARAAAEWRRLGRGSDGLLGERRLGEVRGLAGHAFSAAERELVAASHAALRRRRWRRALAVAAAPVAIAAAVATAAGLGQARQRATRDRAVSEALVAIEASGRTGAGAAELRARAIEAFERDELGPAERLWRQTLEREEQAEAERLAALAALDRALAQDPRDARARALYADVTLARVQWAERRRDRALLPELRADLRRTDDGSREAALLARASVRVEIDPPGGAAALSRYVDPGDGRLVAGGPAPLPAGATAELEPGSYRLDVTSPGRAPAAYPFVVGPREHRTLRVALARAADVPDGMVYVPAGRFLYGSGDDEATRAFLTHQPMHEVELGAFLVARLEATVGQYLEFLRALPAAERPDRLPRNLRLPPGGRASVSFAGVEVVEDQPLCLAGGTCVAWSALPVVSISRDDAAAYAAWLAASGRVPRARLCADREWERAARGADARRFPWGDAEPRPEDACTLATYGGDAARSGPCAVGSHPGSASPFGVLDLTGNVWEWTSGNPDAARPTLAAERGGGYAEAGLLVALPNRGLVGHADFDPETGLRICADLP